MSERRVFAVEISICVFVATLSNYLSLFMSFLQFKRDGNWTQDALTKIGHGHIYIHPGGVKRWSKNGRNP